GCGLQLANFAPRDLAGAVDGVLRSAEGYFVFTSYSLWQSPAQLAGPYVLAGTQGAYWDSLRIANGIDGAGVSGGPAGVGGRGLRLGTAHPAPFRDAVTIEFELAARADVELRVVDVAGREMRRLRLPAET